jgi:hypothetical protein
MALVRLQRYQNHYGWVIEVEATRTETLLERVESIDNELRARYGPPHTGEGDGEEDE